MKKAIALITVLVALCPLFAQKPGVWSNLSLAGRYGTAGSGESAGGLGMDFAQFAYLNQSTFGISSHASVLWDLGPTQTAQVRLTIGPVGTSVIAGGVNLFYGVGLASTAGSVSALGAMGELGLRFRLASDPTGDFALVTGVTGTWYFLSTDRSDVPFRGDVTAYVGCSLGFDLLPRSRTLPVYYV
jgi:hypothetical protein